MNNLKTVLKRPLVRVLTVLGAIVGTGLAVRQYDNHRENERIKAIKTAQIEAGMASFHLDVMSMA